MLVNVMLCYSWCSFEDYYINNDRTMAWVWACYAASLLGFMAMRVK
ncbi:heme exporter protein d (ccmD) [Caudoviricetes sp.]|nr:heme exporter protein d (ccmD) [Caudoviricetes sp.]